MAREHIILFVCVCVWRGTVFGWVNEGSGVEVRGYLSLPFSVCETGSPIAHPYVCQGSWPELTRISPFVLQDLCSAITCTNASGFLWSWESQVPMFSKLAVYPLSLAPSPILATDTRNMEN